MTNKEWLSTLNEVELTEFLTYGLLVKNAQYESLPFHINIVELSRRYISSFDGIYDWLSEEQEYEVIHEENEK